ncbi:MAG: CHAT domain-containing protein [Pirellulaceae bacterium]|nr:CHAT domain-containing protein [Pirellulaceae bacterium]
MEASEVERALVMDENQDAIASVVGEEYAEHLRKLAKEVQQTRGWFGPKQKVFILPGILGSTLVVGDDTIWFDPIDIAKGKLKLLSLDGGAVNVASNGVFWPTYTELYLKLKLAGFDSEYFHFDWRKPIADAGKLLANKIRAAATSNQKVGLVAHSMGGLVSRAAIKSLGLDAFKLIKNVVLLGTPNFGSYAPALVMTSDYSTVQWMEWLDRKSPQGALVKDVFATFVGLAEMTPESDKSGGTNFFDINNYPTQDRAVRKAVLTKANQLQARLAKGSDKIWMIAGAGVDTVVGLETNTDDPSKFKTIMSREGDGTVPLNLAILPGATNRYCASTHGNLPMNNLAIKSTVDILRDGDTSRLSDSPDSFLRSSVQTARKAGAFEDRLRVQSLETRGKADLPDVEDYRNALEPLLGFRPTGEERTASTESAIRSEIPIIISRKKSLRLDLRLTQGDIGDAEGRALMLGVFKDVRPGGAAGAVDAKLGGMLAEVIDRRMFSANVGEIFVMPTRRKNLATEMVVLIGLGNFSEFTLQSLRSSVQNATKTLLNCNVDELVTVPMGGGSGLKIPELTEAIMEGVQAAMLDSRRRLSLRSLCITTKFPKDYEAICESIFDLATSAKFDDMEFVLEREIQSSAERGRDGAAASVLTTGHQSAYLMVRENSSNTSTNSKKHIVDFSMLGTGKKATVLSGRAEVLNAEVDRLLDKINAAAKQNDFFDHTVELGKALAELLLPHDLLTALQETEPNALTVINDLWGSRIPWELMQVGQWRAGLDGNLSRKYSTSNISVAKWLHERRTSPKLELLLVVNPTSDLDGAQKEGKALKDALQNMTGINLTDIWNENATKERLTKEFASGKYDLVHYAGHAYFDESNRSESGILCAGEKVLSGRDLATLDSLPSLVVFNACESARVRSREIPTRMKRTRGNAGKESMDVRELASRNVSFAEAFLRGGVGAYIGTYWPVGDAGAVVFAEQLYQRLLVGASVGKAVEAARQQLFNAKNADWVNYIHYGDIDFVIKTGDRDT